MPKARGLRQKHRASVENAQANIGLAVRKMSSLLRDDQGRLPPPEVVYLRLAQALAYLNTANQELSTVDFEPEKESE